MPVIVIDSTRTRLSYVPILAALPTHNIPLIIYTGNEHLIAACQKNCTIKRRRTITQPKSFGDWFFSHSLYPFCGDISWQGKSCSHHASIKY